MEERRLAVELLHEIKKESQRRFVLLVICIILLFASNMAWLVAWNLPEKEITESYDLQGEDNANVFYNSEGEVQINGEKKRENNNNESNENKTEQTTK